MLSLRSIVLVGLLGLLLLVQIASISGSPGCVNPNLQPCYDSECSVECRRDCNRAAFGKCDVVPGKPTVKQCTCRLNKNPINEH